MRITCFTFYCVWKKCPSGECELIIVIAHRVDRKNLPLVNKLNSLFFINPPSHPLRSWSSICGQIFWIILSYYYFQNKDFAMKTSSQIKFYIGPSISFLVVPSLTFQLVYSEELFLEIGWLTFNRLLYCYIKVQGEFWGISVELK